MIREFKLPDVGEGLTEAEIVSWLVAPGDPVSEDQPVAEVETDKAVVEVPSPVNGTVRELHAEEGEMVPVGEVIISFDTEGEPATTEDDPTAAADEDAVESAVSSVSGTDTEPAEPSEKRVFAAPSARQLARELGVDIATVDGSGPGGRITEQDVRAHATEDDAEPEPVVKSATRRVDEGDTTADAGRSGAGAAATANRDRTLATPATRQLAADAGVDINAIPTDRTRDGEAFVTPEEVEAFLESKRAEAATAEADTQQTTGDTAVEVEAVGGERETRRPYTGVRRTIGEAMERSKYTAPHVTHHDDVDVTTLVETRGRLKEAAAARDTKLSYMPFIVKAVVAALKQHPELNSELDEEAGEIIEKHYYNIGVATATDRGLLVPVVEAADQKGLLTLAQEMNDLVAKARDRSIARDEMQGGTFTVTNFGAVGGEYATPIINYPETAILGLGEIKEKPRVVDGEVVPRHVLTLSLSIDHRVIDGAQAAQFVNTLKEYLAEPDLLLLE